MSLNTILATAPLTTQNYVLKATGTALGQSLIWDNGTNVGIGNTNTSYTLDVSGTGRFTGDLTSLTIKSTYSGTTNWNSFGNQLFIGVNGANNNFLSDNMYYNSGWLFANAGAGAQIYFGASAAGSIDFRTAPTGAAGGTPSITNRMTILQGGNVGIGTSSPTNKLQIGTMTVPYSGNEFAIGNGTVDYAIDVSATSVDMYSSAAMSFATSTTERMRITSGGNVYLGPGYGNNNHRIDKVTSQSSNVLVVSGYDGSNNDTAIFYAVSGVSGNSAACAINVSNNTATNRSINAGGSINASGTDYAEYMEKAVEDIINKGDIAGINYQGKLTNIFNDAISFVVKSTDPAYVGGDTWGTVGSLNKPTSLYTEEELQQYKATNEAARAIVDRIAFSGQVPCNVTGANVGDYIIPIELENGKIGGQAVTNPTFEQYQISVGKIWKIMEDGRAWIAVKIG